jgi:heptosyltransferase-2/heptosyltransferase-3
MNPAPFKYLKNSVINTDEDAGINIKRCGVKTDKILIINPFGIGDVLFTTPLVRQLKAQFNDSHIAFICNSRVAPLLAANKNLNEIFVFDKGDYRALWRRSKVACLKEFFGFLRLIRSKRFDIAIDLSLGHQYGFFLALLGVPVRMGFNYKGRGRFLTHRIDIDGYHDKHIVEYYMDVFDFLCSKAGVKQWPPGRRKLEIFIDEAYRQRSQDFLNNNGVGPADRLLGIVPGAGASWGKTAIYKQWPAGNFASVADQLAASHNLKVVVFGSQDETDICRQVLDSMKQKAINACGKTTLMEFAALLKKCSLVICNDGGPLHMAVAAGVKTVSLFGPVDENVYGPYPPAPEHIVVKEDINCRPCYKRFKFNQCESRLCLLNIRPQDVVTAAKNLL